MRIQNLFSHEEHKKSCPICKTGILEIKRDETHELEYYLCTNDSCKAEFHIDWLKDGDFKSVMILGSRSCGKTTYLASLLYHLALCPETRALLYERWGISTNYYVTKSEFQEEMLILDKLISNYGTGEEDNFTSSLFKHKITLAIKQMFFDGSYPASTIYKMGEDPGEFAKTNSINLILENPERKKYLYLYFIDLPGEVITESNRFKSAMKSVAKAVYSSDGNLFLIDPQSHFEIKNRIQRSNIELPKYIDLPLETILNTLKVTIQQYKRYVSKNQGVFADLLGTGRKHWNFAITKFDTIADHNILPVGEDSQFKSSTILKQFTENKFHDREFFSSLINYENYEVYCDTLKEIINEHLDNALINKLANTFGIVKGEVFISPVASYVQGIKGSIPSRCVVEPFIHLLKQ